MSDQERYARHSLIPGWDQARLGGAGVVVVGLGALGNEVARILALSGVGRMVLCDPDRVEISNLSRCGLFREADIGARKVEAAARSLAELAPACRLDSRPLPLVHGVGLAELRDAELVVACLDSTAARLQLAGRCNLVRAAMIDGGTHPWGGEVRPYLDPDGACYGCGLGGAARARSDSPWSCVEAAAAVRMAEGATAAASVLVGGWMALTALRVLLDLPVPPGLLQIDGPAGSVRRVLQARDADCPLHLPAGPVRVLHLSHIDSVGALRATLPIGSVPLAWAPVMEALECGRCNYREPRWGLPPGGVDAAPHACPDCGASLRPCTTLELEHAPGEIALAALGVAPREILAVRTPDGWDWVELGDG